MNLPKTTCIVYDITILNSKRLLALQACTLYNTAMSMFTTSLQFYYNDSEKYSLPLLPYFLYLELLHISQYRFQMICSRHFYLC